MGVKVGGGGDVARCMRMEATTRMDVSSALYDTQNTMLSSYPL